VWLEVLSGEDAGRVVEVDRPLVLGRVRGADLVIRDARASRRHAELTPVDAGLRLRDLGSANGTLVGGERARDVVLRGGEEIAIGSVRIAVLAEEPAVTGAPIPEPVRRRPQVETEGPSWSMMGRLVDARTRRGRRLTYAALGVAAAAIAAVAVLALGGEGEDERVAAVVRDVAPATLLVDTRRAGAASGSGTGWVLDADAGLVVTAAHVVNTGERFVVHAGDRQAEARLIGAAPCEDLALLRASRGVTSAQELELGSRSDAQQGETVLAFGFPLGTVPGDIAASTRGVVSAPRTRYRDPAPDVPAYTDAIRTDTALDPGFSGGPLVDLDGRVVGINAAARANRTGERSPQAANYAIGAGRARAVLAALRAGRSVGSIGAGFGYPSPEDLARGNIPAGLWIQGVIPGSGADRAGLRDGDYVVAVNRRPLDGTLSGWCRAVAGIASGQTAELELSFGDRTRRTLDVRFD
jgi:S1-C subfamily serine protease